MLLDGARELLDSVQGAYEMYLLSLGVESWQMKKFDLCKLETYFDPEHIMFTPSVVAGKIGKLQEAFGENFDGEGIVLFNDKPDETANMLQAFPKLHALVRREVRDERYSEADFEKAHDEFGDRFVWRESLKDLSSVFDTQYQN